MSGIFICYRRDDTAPYARLLRESLAARFGRDEIYRDLDSVFTGATRRAVEVRDRECFHEMCDVPAEQWVSSGREPPPPALSGPDVTVSRHPAPTGRPEVRAMRCQ